MKPTATAEAKTTDKRLSSCPISPHSPLTCDAVRQLMRRDDLQ